LKPVSRQFRRARRILLQLTPVNQAGIASGLTPEDKEFHTMRGLIYLNVSL
jgi:hypothetical protein